MELIHIIKKRITLDNFIALQNGTLIELFYKEKPVNIKKYSKTLLYQLTMTTNKAGSMNQKYLQKVICSYENFIDFKLIKDINE